jgi:diguanylate cyclase (GGDEF)-like protein
MAHHVLSQTMIHPTAGVAMPIAPARILLLEDNPSDRQFMDACLHDGGYAMELHHAARLEEASDHLKRQRYEMVIADLNLPDTEGLETFFKVKELASDAAIVVMTGMDDAQLATRAVLAGAQDYLIKGDLAPKRVWQSVSNALQRHSQLRHITGVAQDLRKKNSSLRELAYVDALTGLANRRGLAKMLAQAPAHRPVASHALLVDVDDFKVLNDLFGYGRGDLALKELGRSVRALLKPADIGARIGGDEFLLLVSVADTGEAVAFAQRIRKAAGDAGRIASGGSFKMSVSVGVAPLIGACPSVEAILERAQGPLRSGKGGGKDRVCFSDAAPVSGAGQAKRAAPVIEAPFFEIRTGKVAGHRFMIDEGAEAHDTDGSSLDRINDLLWAAVQDGEGLECHLYLSPLQLLRLKPEDLAAGPKIEPCRIRLTVPAVPMSPLPAGLLESVHRLQFAGWGIGLSGLDLSAHNWANLISLEPAAVTLSPAMVSGVASDHDRLRGMLRLCRALSGLGACIVAGGVQSSADLKALDRIGVAYASDYAWKGDLR